MEKHLLAAPTGMSERVEHNCAHLPLGRQSGRRRWQEVVLFSFKALQAREKKEQGNVMR